MACSSSICMMPQTVTNTRNADGSMDRFLKTTTIIDWQDDRVLALAGELRHDLSDDISIARASFEWVRDNIEHSIDFERCEVTCRSSDVLDVGTGFCYAKSHLLAAILRANRIPTGFCYQRVSITGDGPPFCLHGLNAVHLKEHGWYRVDPRGNRDGIDAQFTPPVEKLAFELSLNGEYNLPQILDAPLPCVVTALQTTPTAQQLHRHLPDADL